MINEECFCCKTGSKSSWRIFQLFFGLLGWEQINQLTDETFCLWAWQRIRLLLFCSLHVKSVIFLNVNLMLQIVSPVPAAPYVPVFHYASYVSHRVYVWQFLFTLHVCDLMSFGPSSLTRPLKPTNKPTHLPTVGTFCRRGCFCCLNLTRP